MTTPSNMTGSHDADMNDGSAAALFQVRVWLRSQLRASIERTSTSKLRLLVATPHFKR